MDRITEKELIEINLKERTLKQQKKERDLIARFKAELVDVEKALEEITKRLGND